MRAILILLATITIAAGQTFDTRLQQAKRAAFFRLVGDAQELWTPMDITSADVHAFYSDESDLTFSGTKVIQWDDLSGNDKHLVPFGADDTPTVGTNSGIRTLVFDGGDALTVTNWGSNLTQTFWIYGAYDNKSQRDNATLWGSDNGGVFVKPAHLSLFRFNAGANLDISPNQGTGLYILGTRFDGTNSTVRQNGEVIISGSTGSNAMGPLVVGRNPNVARFMTADYSWVLVLDGSLSTAEAEKIEGWSYHHYGYGDLQTNHVYYASPPYK